MSRLKQWSAVTAVIVLAVLAAGWFLLVSPKRAEAADLRQQALDQQRATSQLKTKLAVLKEQAKDLPKKQAELAAVMAKLPADPAQPALLRQLAAAADAAGVELVTITPGGLAPVVVAAPATSTAATTTTTAGTTSTTAATPASAAPSSGTLMSMPVTLSVAGGYFELEQFLAGLEDLPRALRVTSVALAPGGNPVQSGSAIVSLEDGQHLTATITGNAFVAAGAAPATPVVAPAASTGK